MSFTWLLCYSLSFPTEIFATWKYSSLIMATEWSLGIFQQSIMKLLKARAQAPIIRIRCEICFANLSLIISFQHPSHWTLIPVRSIYQQHRGILSHLHSMYLIINYTHSFNLLPFPRTLCVYGRSISFSCELRLICTHAPHLSPHPAWLICPSSGWQRK